MKKNTEMEIKYTKVIELGFFYLEYFKNYVIN